MDTNSLGKSILLQLILIHYNCGVKCCKVRVNQHTFFEALVVQKAVNLSCKYEASDCSGNEKIHWFRYLASTYEKIDPNKGNRFSIEKPSENTNLLIIKDIEVLDSGIYICDVVFPEFQHFAGQGTTLVIRDKPDVAVTPTNTALIVLCTLLFIYCIAVFSYYTFKSKWRIWNKPKKSGFTMEKNKTFRTRSAFQAIAAEYHKRYDRKNKKQSQVIEDDTIYQNTQDLH
ncbi:immunoglobulin superfamily member 6 [Rhinoderma darwinii]|uniref:immunoglobulin superfamily member 6 n=1 Tax=Rhinoderma darwinii TaxID=43563 RepID=UPI003F681CA6